MDDIWRSDIWRSRRRSKPSEDVSIVETGEGKGGGLYLYLGFVALLRAEAGSGRVELLGDHAQELGLVLRAVAVRRADVHHLDGGGREVASARSDRRRNRTLLTERIHTTSVLMQGGGTHRRRGAKQLRGGVCR